MDQFKSICNYILAFVIFTRTSEIKRDHQEAYLFGRMRYASWKVGGILVCGEGRMGKVVYTKERMWVKAGLSVVWERKWG